VEYATTGGRSSFPYSWGDEDPIPPITKRASAVAKSPKRKARRKKRRTGPRLCPYCGSLFKLPGFARHAAKCSELLARRFGLKKGLLQVDHAPKYAQAQGRWELATKRGVLIRSFATESELESWWREFQMARGRQPLPLSLGRVSAEEASHTE
jgi:hypothetical protein